MTYWKWRVERHEEALVWAIPSSQASRRVEGSPPAHATSVGFMGAESEIKPGNRKATPQESLEPGKEKPQVSPCHYPCSLSQCCLPCLLAATTVILSPAPPSRDDLEPKGGAREAEVSFSPWSSGFLGHISCVSSPPVLRVRIPVSSRFKPFPPWLIESGWGN